jgi:hypothetical protein
MTLAILVAFVTLLPNAALGQKVFQPTSKQEETLRKFLRDYAGRPYPLLEKEGPTRYSATFIDLKDDGTQEVIVYLTGRNWCGSGGCGTLILIPQGSSYKVLTRITITWPPIRVLATKSHGWHDLSVRVHGGGIIQPYDAELSFDGKTYATNPTMPPAQQLTQNVEAKVVVSASTVGRRLYP